MKKLRFAVLLLTLSMLLSLVACTNTPDPGTESGSTEEAGTGTQGTVEGTEAQTEIPFEEVVLNLVNSGTASYKIVYPSDAGGTVTGAITTLKEKFKEYLGVAPKVETDYLLAGQTADPNAPEILIGTTNRPETREALDSIKAINDYVVMVSGNKLVIAGLNDNATANAAYYFINKVLTKVEKSKQGTLSFSNRQNYYYSATYPFKGYQVLGNDMSLYSIVLPKDSSFSEWRFAQRISYAISSRTGLMLPVVTDDVPNSGYEIRIGKTNRTTETVGKAEYAVVASGNNIQILADCVYGYEYAFEYCNNQILGLMNKSAANAGDLARNNYTENLKKSEIESLVDKKGDLRIMYYNVWGWNESKTNPTEQRNRMLGEICAEVFPDVLCLQEYTEQMRNAAKFPVTETLKAYGYAEVDVTALQNNPRTATPILYRTEVLTLNESGIFKFTVGGGSDKFVTWAVFTVKQTGKKVGVLSVHLAYETTTEGNTYRMTQLNDVIRIAKQIESEKECAVIIGGDMNCTSQSEPYRKCLQNGFTDVQTVAEITDSVVPNFCGDPTFNTTIGVFERLDKTKKPYNDVGIDHVFYLGNGITFKRYDSLGDVCTMAVSDHSPTVVDFELGTYVKPEAETFGEWTKNY